MHTACEITYNNSDSTVNNFTKITTASKYGSNSKLLTIPLNTILYGAHNVHMEFDVRWNLVENFHSGSNNNKNRWSVSLVNVPDEDALSKNQIYYNYIKQNTDSIANTKNVIFNMGLISSAGLITLNNKDMDDFYSFDAGHITNKSSEESGEFWNRWIHVTLEINFESKKMYVLCTYLKDDTSLSSYIPLALYNKFFTDFVDTSCTQATTFAIHSMSTSNDSDEWLGLANMSICCSR